VLSSLEPSPAEPVSMEPGPEKPGPVVEQHASTESTPSIGDEDIFEPVHQAAASAMPTPALARPEPRRQEEKPPSQSRKSAPVHGRAARRVLFAAAIAVLLAACVVAGLHFGIFRPGAAAPIAPAATKQEITTSPDSSSRPADMLYVVKEGDTLWDIAARFTGDAHNFGSLAAYNSIPDPDLISPGQVIKVPSGLNLQPAAR